MNRELLVAYLDGEGQASERESVEAAMTRDPALPGSYLKSGPSPAMIDRPVRARQRTRRVRRSSSRFLRVPHLRGLVNIALPLLVALAGTSSCMTSQCSISLPFFTRKMSTANIGFGPQPT